MRFQGDSSSKSGSGHLRPDEWRCRGCFWSGPSFFGCRVPCLERAVIPHVQVRQERRAERCATHARSEPASGGSPRWMAGSADRPATVPPQDLEAVVSACVLGYCRRQRGRGNLDLPVGRACSFGRTTRELTLGIDADRRVAECAVESGFKSKSLFFAPTGQHKLAWGNAPGSLRTEIPSPEGAANIRACGKPARLR